MDNSLPIEYHHPYGVPIPPWLQREGTFGKEYELASGSTEDEASLSAGSL